MAEAVFGLLGVLIGGLLQLVAQNVATLEKRRVDRQRRVILRKLLTENERWRSLATCQKVIGADAQDTKRLLIEINARGSKGQADVWGLISRNPLGGED